MLRWILACIIVANLLFLAWSQHWLVPLGLAPLSSEEPERLQRQIHPEAIALRKNKPRPTQPPTAIGAPTAQPPDDVPAPTTPENAPLTVTPSVAQ